MTIEIRHYIQRGCTDRATRALLLDAVSTGARIKPTRNGVIVHGPDGLVTAHFSPSDHRAVKNLRARLRRAGVRV